MSRLKGCFDQLQSAGRKALIPYIAAGDPDLPITLGLMHALVKCGADIIELGIPFSDPSSDGPVIQRAVERALEANTSLSDVLELVAEFRQTDSNTPVVLMGYLNPIEHMGYEVFVERAEKAGVDGVLTVDMPPEESDEFLGKLKQSSMDSIFLVAPTTREARAKSICEHSSGYVYYVSLKGVTGASNLDADNVRENLDRLRQYTDLPLGVGFGIKDAERAAQIADIADAVVVGSALVDLVSTLEKGREYPVDELAEHIGLISEMRSAMDKTTSSAK